MNPAAAALMVAVALAALALGRQARGATGPTIAAPPVDLERIYQEQGARNGVDPLLLRALARVESSENPNVGTHPDGGSRGLMGVYCVAGPDGRCSNRLNLAGWPPTVAELTENAETNVHFAAGVLAWNQRTYGWLRGIAVYNMWAARLDPPEGPFQNQQYVARVLAEYIALGGRPPEA